MKPPEPLRVFLLGSRAAGKTCFLAGLATLGQPDRHTPFQVHAAGATARRLDELAGTLARQQWPAPTNVTEIHELAVVLDGRAVDLVIVDYPGEDLETELRLLQPDKIAVLFEHYQKAHAFLLLLDPARDLLPLDDAMPAVIEARARSLQATLTAVQSVALQRGVAFAETASRRRDVAIVLTKADLYPELTTRPAAKRFVRQHAPAFDGKLQLLAKGLGYFPLSSVGAVEKRWEEGYERTAPAATIQPRGYDQVFRWLLARHAYRNRRGLYRSLVATAALLLTAGLFGGGWEIGRHLQQRQTLGSAGPAIDILEQTREGGPTLLNDTLATERRRVVEKELDRLRDLLQAARSEEGIDEVRRGAERLEKADAGSLASEVVALKALAVERREKFLYGRVRLAFESKSPEFTDLAGRYLKEFDHPGRRAEVAVWLKTQIDEQRNADRLAIKSERPFNAATLLSKSEKIHAYLAKWGRIEDKSDAEAMKRAADLAGNFTASRSYNVRLRRSGDYTSSRTHTLALFVGDRLIHHYRATDSSRTANWSGPAVAFTWKTGESVTVRLGASGWTGMTATAEAVDASPLALLTLVGKQTLNAAPGWDGSFAGAPSVECEIEGITADDAKALRDFVLPGDRW